MGDLGTRDGGRVLSEGRWMKLDEEADTDMQAMKKGTKLEKGPNYWIDLNETSLRMISKFLVS